MGYVHSLMLVEEAAALAAVEPAVEAAVLVLAEEPPHAARAPAAPRMPAAVRIERRERQWLIVVSASHSGCYTLLAACRASGRS